MYKKILVTIDLTDTSSWEKTLPIAVEYAQAFGSALQILSVVPDYGMSVVAQYFPEGFESGTVEQARKELEDLAAKFVPPAVERELTVAYGTIYDEIISAAKKGAADLIIMASYRPDLSDYLLGPNAARVVRHADCSVLVVRD